MPQQHPGRTREALQGPRGGCQQEAEAARRGRAGNTRQHRHARGGSPGLGQEPRNAFAGGRGRDTSTSPRDEGGGRDGRTDCYSLPELEPSASAPSPLNGIKSSCLAELLLKLLT